MRLIGFTALAVLSALLIGCGASVSTVSETGATSAPTDDAVSFLKWSMDQNEKLKSYKASCEWSMEYDGRLGGTKATREIAYAKPNQFKVVNNGTGFMMTAVSDGKKLLEYTSSPDLPAQSYASPDSIATANTTQMMHPMFCGTLLYKFFGGSDSYDDLVDANKGPVTFGKDEKAPGGEEAKVVKFYAKNSYGNTEVLIGKKTGLVYRISYDDDGLRKVMEEHPEFGGKDIPKSLTTETFGDIKTGVDIPAKEFDVTPPKGLSVKEMGAGGTPTAPVPVGSPAPDFEVTDLSGKTTRLSSLKGKVVMIDFWATWCGPCREFLPTTNKMHQDYAAKGLQVMTVSNEDPSTISSFVKKEGYTFPVFVDGKNEASKAYGVDAIPTLVIIDADGNLSSYTVGLEDEDNVVQNLRKAGLKI